MQKIAYCLLNCGDDKVEDLALRLFNNDYSNINNIGNINNNKTILNNQFKGEEDDNYYNNEKDINEIQTNDIKSKENSGRSSLGNNLRSSASSKRNSLKKNQSQMNITRKPIVTFK